MGARTDADHEDGRYRHWPDLAFWYGLTWAELRRMPRGVRRTYERELPRLRAEAQAERIDAASFPHMKKEDQRRVVRRIERATRQVERETATDLTPEQLEAMAAGTGIGIKLVGKDDNDG